MPEIIPNWHPLLVHFTIALLSVSVMLFIASRLPVQTHIKEHALIVARWNLWLGAGFAIATAGAGWYAYNTVAHDAPSHAAMTLHRNWALATIAVVIPLALWSWFKRRHSSEVSVRFVVVTVLAGGMLMSTGWHGAEAVYRYGLGVMSLPKSEGDGHAHEHADGNGHGDSEKAAAGNSHDIPGETAIHADGAGSHRHDDRPEKHGVDSHADDGHAH